MTTLMHLQKKLSKNLLITQQAQLLKGGSCPPPIDEGASNKGKRTRSTTNHM